jgi:hypothetical protein
MLRLYPASGRMLRLDRASGRLCSLRPTIKDELFIKPPAGFNPAGGWVRENRGFDGSILGWF